MRKIVAVAVTALAFAIVAGSFTLSLAVKGSLDGQVANLRQQNTRLRAALTAESRQESGDYANVRTQLGNFTKPSDPLSAYTDICNQNMTNNSTGIDQTYYFPCTNSAVTIPQPGQ